MREIIFISILCGMLNFVACQKKVTDYPIQPVNFTQVHLADSFWSPKLSINREVSIPTAVDFTNVKSTAVWTISLLPQV